MATGRALGALAWLLPLTVMAVVGTVRASWPGLWGDELATWGMATASWQDLWQTVQHAEASIAPYYAFMHGWTALAGTSEFALRLPSIVAMAGAAGLIGAIGARLASPRFGLVAGLLFVAVPAASRYAQEARPYAIALFFATLCTYLLLGLMDRPRWWRYAAYALAVMATGAGHLVALLILAAHGLIILAQRRRVFLPWLLAAIVGVLPVVPVVLLGRGQQEQISWIPLASWDRLGQLPQGLAGGALVGGILLGLAVLALSMRNPGLVYAACAVVPTVLLFAAGQFMHLWLPRYLLFTVPAWVLLAAVTSARDRVVRGVLVVVTVAAVGMSAQVGMRTESGHGQNPRSVAAYLESHADLSDGIVFGSNVGGDQRVARDVVARYLAVPHRPADVFLAEPARTGGHLAATECPQLDTCLDDLERLWVLRLGTRDDPLAEIGAAKETLLRARYNIADVVHKGGFTIALLTRKPVVQAVAR
ncbi:glycosyltransferase family 39 protein [Catellatospora vulcania]|uniref:glycosyltransferase family 39 protein n=1 Tax=Catellatospora vulcania TaxID=1460450 RepID=UPI0018AFC350|nr:glycosyltransferase family 39 protein [Catellatospora vulcania]